MGDDKMYKENLKKSDDVKKALSPFYTECKK